MNGIQDKVIAITGASSGIGEATAALLAQRGARLVLGARRADRLDAVATRIAQDGGGRAIFVATDVGDAGHAGRLIEQTLAAFGRLDVLINNAGIIKTADFLEISEADFDAVLGRIRERGLDHWADPARHRPGEINHNDGGRGVYFPDPDGHGLEVITRPYGGGAS